MKEQFDNLNSNDGRKRIEMPPEVKKPGNGGFKFSKCIVFIVAAVIVGIYALLVIINIGPNKEDKGPILTNHEWLELLSENFGDPSLLDGLQNPKDDLTGEYVALTAMKAIGKERLEYIADKKDLDDSDIIDLAVKKKVVSKKQLKKKLTQSEAEEAATKALDIKFDPACYPEYFEVESKQPCIDADRWDISSISEDGNTIIASLDEVPSVGDPIIYTNEYGVARAKYVTSVDKTADDKYQVELKNIDDLSEILDSISFSGVAEFGYLTGDLSTDSKHGTNGTGGAGENETASSVGFHNPFVTEVYAAEKKPIKSSEWEWFEDKTALKVEKCEIPKCNLEFQVGFTQDLNNKKKHKFTSYAKATSNNVSKSFKFEMDENKKLTMSGNVSYANDVFGAGLDFKEKKKKKGTLPDISYMKEDLAATLCVKVKGLTVCASGYYQWADPDDSKNYVEVLVKADEINISTGIKYSMKDQIKIATLPIPIPVTGGTISINLSLYLVASVSGELTLYFEIDDPHVGITASMGEGIKTPHGISDTDFGIRAKVEIGSGIKGDVAVNVLEIVDLLDPGVEVKGYASITNVDVGDDYERLPAYPVPCAEMVFQVPVVKLEASGGGDSLLAMLFDALGIDAPFELIKKDAKPDPSGKFRLVPHREQYHVEIDAEKIWLIPMREGQKHDEVCTHIKEKEPETEAPTEPITDDQGGPTKPSGGGNIIGDIESKIDGAIDQKVDEVQQDIQQSIQDAIDQWFMNACSGCY